MPLSTLISPSELHAKAAAEVKERKPVETLPLFHTVLGFINNSTGNSRAEAPFFSIYTTEYTIIPVPGSMLDDEAPRVKMALQEHGYYVTLKEDALARFHEEALMIVCWDPRVIAASKVETEEDVTVLPGNCVMPGRSHERCSHCFDCVEYFNAEARKLGEEAQPG